MYSVFLDPWLLYVISISTFILSDIKQFKSLKHQSHSHMFWIVEYNLLYIDLWRIPLTLSLISTHTHIQTASANTSVTPSLGSMKERVLRGLSKKWKRLDDWSVSSTGLMWLVWYSCLGSSGFVTGFAFGKSEAERIINDVNYLLMVKLFIDKPRAVNHSCLGSSLCQSVETSNRQKEVSCPNWKVKVLDTVCSLPLSPVMQCQLQSLQAEFGVASQWRADAAVLGVSLFV